MNAATSIVTGVDFVSIPTRDVAATARFHENVLGVERSSAWQRPGEEPMWHRVRDRHGHIELIASETLGILFRPHKVPLAVHVDDVAAARAELESRGVSSGGR